MCTQDHVVLAVGMAQTTKVPASTSTISILVKEKLESIGTMEGGEGPIESTGVR